MGTLHLRLSLPQRLALALGLFVAALLLRFAVLPVEERLAFLTFYPCAVVAFYLCGRGPGWLTAGLSALAGYYIFSPPFWSFGLHWRDGISTMVFLASCGLFSAVIGQLQTTSAELRRALADIDHARQQYQAILEEQSDWICRYRGDGTVIYANEALCKAFGLQRAAIVGSRWHPEVWREDLPRVEQSLRSLAPAQPSVTIEKRVLTPTGLRWAQFVDSATFDSDGRLLEIQKVGRDITERKNLESRLQAAIEETRDLYDNAPCGYHSLDAHGRYTAVNATALDWMGVTREEAVGKLGPMDFLTPQSQATFRQTFPQFMSSGRLDNLLLDFRHRNGSLRRVSVNATAITDTDGKYLTSRSVMHDVTESERIREALRQLTIEQAAMLDHELVGIFKTRSRSIVWNNRGLEQMFGYATGELIGQSSRCFHRDDASFVLGGEQAYPVLKAGGHFRGQFELVCKDGSPIWVEAGGVELSRDKDESLWLMTDVSASKRYQQQIERLAHYDALTGLPNRGTLNIRLEQALAVARGSQQALAVCVLDLDGFKPVNDQHGHAAGDEVLKAVAERLMRVLRATDTASRFGGDEFALLLNDLDNLADCQAVLQRLLQLIEEPVLLANGKAVRVSASIGVALYPNHARTSTDLLHHADQAMYRAKQLGKSRVSVFGDAQAGAERVTD